MKTKITWKDIAPAFIYSSGRGYEIHKREWDGRISYPTSGMGMTKDERASVAEYIKGLKVLLKIANTLPAFSETFAAAYTGKRPPKPVERFEQLCYTTHSKNIRALGRGAAYEYHTYVDGSCDVEVFSE